ncbi:MAG: divalent-cation tolerance protein CutA [Acidobacteriota bacterium]
MLIVITTVSTQAAGEELAEKIVNAKLAACVQILPKMTSIYVWGNDLAKESEHLLLIKTLKEKYDELSAFITSNHGYQVPEIVAIRSESISSPYLAWMMKVFEVSEKSSSDPVNT